MHSFQSRWCTLDSSDIDTASSLRAALTVVLAAAGLLTLTMVVRQAPIGVAREAGAPLAGEYVELRDRVGATLPAVRVTSDPVEIVGRGAAIGTAVRTARHARQGEVFTPVVAARVRALITADLARRSAADRAGLMSEVPAMPPGVNEPYPTGEAFATFPPLLLQALPGLPDDLEYRFMGRDVIIRDARTNLIVDVLPGVIAADVTR